MTDAVVAQPNQPDPADLSGVLMEVGRGLRAVHDGDDPAAVYIWLAPLIRSVGRDAARDALDEVERIVKAEAGAGDVYMRADVLSVISQVRRARAEGPTP